MMMFYLTIFTVIFALITADDPCKFTDTKGVIDLTSLGRTDGKAAYPDKFPPTASDYMFSYNPCKSFSEGTTCIDVAVCQAAKDGAFTFILGKHDSAAWSPGAGLGSLPSVSYNYNDKKVTVNLQCGIDTDNELEALGESPTNNYKFRLTHKCACWNGCSNSPQTTTKSSGGGGSGASGTGGTVFVVILCVGLFVYFAGFAAYYHFRLQRTGTELIAHRTFWVALPGYFKDGTVYLYRRVAGKGGNPYQSV